MFKLYECDVGIKVGGVSYDFEHVNQVQIEDPERNQLTRGVNAKNKVGLVFKDGLKDPKRWTIPIINMSAALKAVMDSAFENQTRLDVYCVSRKTGDSKWAKNAIMSNRPQQLTLDDTAESLDVSLEFVTYDSSEIIKE